MITFQNISVSHQSQTLFSDVTFTVPSGGKVVIAGRSGIGKSTLLFLLLGFYRAQHGTILFRDKIIDDISIWQVRKEIAYVDQDSSIGSGKVEDLLSQYFQFHAQKNAPLDEKKIRELIDYFELHPKILTKQVETLSGGERQRVALIIAILLNRKVFLLDEVTAALDQSLKEKTIDFFLSQPEWTLLIVAHDTLWHTHKNVLIYNLEKREWTR
jgi:putative ABC transport system ATP-binding protein